MRCWNLYGWVGGWVGGWVVYLLSLANPMSPIHRLKVNLGVPIRIIEHHGVSRCQVDTQPTSTGGEEEAEFLTPWFIEYLYRERRSVGGWWKRRGRRFAGLYGWVGGWVLPPQRCRGLRLL